MAGTDSAPVFESRPAGLTEPSSLSCLPLAFTTSESPTTESTDSNGAVRPVEAITMSTLHGMLARVLEQTNALWQAQASTNRILDELRQSIPAPQEHAEIVERLGRVEALAETLAHGRRADLQPGEESGITSNIYQDGPIPQNAPQNVPQPSFIRDVGETPSYGAPVNPQPPPGPVMSTQETTHHTDAILHASGERYPTSAPSVHIHNDEEVRLHPPVFQRVLFSW
jgi:hypothetical protein